MIQSLRHDFQSIGEGALEFKYMTNCYPRPHHEWWLCWLKICKILEIIRLERERKNVRRMEEDFFS